MACTTGQPAIRWQVVLLMIQLLAAPTLAAQCNVTRMFSSEPLTGVRLSWAVDGDILFGEISSRGTGWMAWGLGHSTMPGDAILAWIDEEGAHAIDANVGTSEMGAIADTDSGGTDDVIPGSVSGEFENGWSTVRFARPLDTKQRGDHKIMANYENEFTVAWHPTLLMSLSAQHALGARAYGLWNPSSATMRTAQEGTVTGRFAVMAVHGLTMFGTWCVFVPVGAFVSRNLKHYDWWIETHKKLVTFGVAGAFVLAVVAVANTGGSFTTTHSVIGVIMILCVMGQLALGRAVEAHLISFHSKFRVPTRTIHRAVGWSLLTLAVYNTFLGIDLLFVGDYASMHNFFTTAVMIWLILLLLAFGGMETFYLVKKCARRKVLDTIQEANPVTGRLIPIPPELQEQLEALPEVTMDMLNRRVASGSRLTVIDGWVLDVRTWIFAHPGGQSLIRDYIGLDCTAEFFGTTSHDNLRLKPHSHNAWHKVLKLAVGRTHVASTSRDGPRHTLEKKRATTLFDLQIDQKAVSLLHNENTYTRAYLHAKRTLTKCKRPTIEFSFAIPVGNVETDNFPQFEDGTPYIELAQPAQYIVVQHINKKWEVVERPYDMLDFRVAVIDYWKVANPAATATNKRSAITNRPTEESPLFSLRKFSHKYGIVKCAIKIMPKGDMGQYLCKLKPGQRLKLKGPLGLGVVRGVPAQPGHVTRKNMYRTLVLIAGGSGITPLYNLLRWYHSELPAVKSQRSARKKSSSTSAAEGSGKAPSEGGIELEVLIKKTERENGEHKLYNDDTNEDDDDHDNNNDAKDKDKDHENPNSDPGNDNDNDNSSNSNRSNDDNGEERIAEEADGAVELAGEEEEEGPRQVLLLFGNVSVEDIPFREELEQMVASSGGALRVHFALTRPPDEWAGETGRVDASMLHSVLHDVSLLPNDASEEQVEQYVDTTKVVVCGPPGFNDSVLTSLLDDMHFPGPSVRVMGYNNVAH